MTPSQSPLSSTLAEAAPVDDFERIMAAIDEAAGMLEATNEESESRGELAPDVARWLKDLRLATLLLPKDLGGYAMSPTQALTIWEKIAYLQASAGWVGFIHAGIGFICAGYMGKAGTDILFAPGTSYSMAGAGAPTGVAEKVSGGYRVTGRWSYGSGVTIADYSRSGAVLHIDGEPQLDARGRPIVVSVYLPTDKMVNEGNWDVLGLQGTGSIDYSYHDVFCPDALAYDTLTTEPKRDPATFQIGAMGVASLGHSSVAVALGRRILDEVAAFARKRSMRSDISGKSDSFWEEFARMEARVRAARAFLFEVWHEVEGHMAQGKVMPTRLHTLIRLSAHEVHAAGAAAADFAYRAAGGAALRRGVIQRLFREMYVAIQHLIVSPLILRGCGRELMGAAPGQVWDLYELIDPS
ncbi:acyl-CoA dehydrogenase family protein [Sphingomonas sp. YL-JM2C]|jgi:alkylation response protein AidB-like acyl-CoA dehydrogenase